MTHFEDCVGNIVEEGDAIWIPTVDRPFKDIVIYSPPGVWMGWESEVAFEVED